MQKFSIEDKALAKQVRALIKDHTKKRALENRKFRISYGKRLEKFKSKCPSFNNGKSLGFLSWYGMTGSSISRISYGDGCEYEYLSIEGDVRIPTGLTFNPRELAEHFLPNEDLPCVMRGSLLGIRMRNDINRVAQYRQPLEVIERWLRRVKFTCVSPDEWRDLRASKDGIKFIDRVLNKWGVGGGWGSRERLEEQIRYMVDDDRNYNSGGRTVLLNGKTQQLNREKVKAIDSLDSVSNKLKKLEKFAKLDDRIRTQIAA